MDVRRSRVGPSIRTEGGLLPADLLARIAEGDRTLPGIAESDYGLAAGVRFGEAITASWNRLVGAWSTFTAAREGAEADDVLTTPTRERWLLPLLDELGFGRPALARPVEIDGSTYAVSHGWEHVPLHLVGAGVELDRRTPGVRGAAGAAPHALVQDLLNRSDGRLWGLVSNGRTLRLLRDSTSLTRQAYVEFDLEAMFDGEAYADFSLLWLVCHRTRFEGDRPVESLLERWSRLAADEGTRALDKLRDGVTGAIEQLGAGFLSHPSNHALRDALRGGTLDRQDFYRELLRLAYRLIFLFTAEDRRDEDTGRELILDPAASDDAVDRYRHYYSTTRLRVLAVRRRGTRHADLWVALRRVIAALGSDGGAPSVGLPPIGSFLFGPTACPDLDAADLRNEDLLSAIRSLATIEENRRLRPVDYRNLGAEELGGIYESLLELHPRMEIEANPPMFALATAAGHERKTTGSYYTPSSLIENLLETALEPVLDETVADKNRDAAEAAILALAVVDPAAGSGHFLVAAAHRIAKRLAEVRSGEGEPPPGEVRGALRDVIAHCIYAVDANPMAVELCKVSLWLEALEPGKPLSFLDAHVKVGNSLFGTTPELIEAGVPDAAYAPIAGDDPAVARALRTRNATEKRGQQSLLEAGLELPIEELAAAAQELDRVADHDLRGLNAKEKRHREYLSSIAYLRARLGADAWCAAFVAPKVSGEPALTTGAVRAFATDPHRVPATQADLVGHLARRYGFFQWPIEFPQVFARGGFDVVLGNPPWEQVQLEEKQFFAERSPTIANARNAAERKRMIAALERDDPTLWHEYRTALRVADGESHLLRHSGRFPLTGLGRINTYSVFAETMRSLLGPTGRAGIIVPTGIATDDTTKRFFGDLARGHLTSLYSFENEEKLFSGIDHRVKFCLLTMAGRERPQRAADFVFFARQVTALDDEERHFTLTPEDFELLNPNTRTCPTFRSRRDAEIAKTAYRRVPVFVVEDDPDGNPWGVSFMQGIFNMASDSGLFHDAPAPDRVPLYEAKMVYQFDHRYGTYSGQTQAQANLGTLPRPSQSEKEDPTFAVAPKYWVDRAQIEARLAERWSGGWLLGWRDITYAGNERTVIASALPRAGVGHNMPIALSARPEFPVLLANLNSFALDWFARQKVGGNHLTFGILNQLPILPPDAYGARPTWLRVSLAEWVRGYVVELAFTADEMKPFATDLGWDGPPFIWNDERRSALRAEVDAAFFHLYGLDRDEVAHLMESFWVVRDREEKEHGEFRTKRLILEAYEAMEAATPEAPFASQLSPSPGDPAAAHPPRSGELPGRWIPWEELRAVPTTLSSTPLRPNAARNRSSHAVVYPQATPGMRRAAEAPAGAGGSYQPSLSELIGTVESDNGWRPEEAIDPSSLVVGARVRHRSFGEGMVLGVRQVDKRTSLLIRFSGGEREIAFGFGFLEFPVEPAAYQ